MLQHNYHKSVTITASKSHPFKLKPVIRSNITVQYTKLKTVLKCVKMLETPLDPLLNQFHMTGKANILDIKLGCQ